MTHDPYRPDPSKEAAGQIDCSPKRVLWLEKELACVNLMHSQSTDEVLRMERKFVIAETEAHRMKTHRNWVMVVAFFVIAGLLFTLLVESAS